MIFTSRWVTRECNTSTRSFTHVTKYHCHNCNSSSFDNSFVNVVKFTIDDSAFVHPRTEYSTNSSPHLIFWILREVFTFFCFVHCFIFRNDSLKFFCCEFSIFFNSTNSFYFVNDSFEFIVVNTHSNVTEHLDKAAVSIPCKAWIVCFVCKSNNRLIIKTEVEDCIHHTRHRFSSTRTNRNQERIIFVTKFFTENCFKFVEIFIYLSVKICRIFSTQFVVFLTNIDRNCESRWNWKT